MADLLSRTITPPMTIMMHESIWRSAIFDRKVGFGGTYLVSNNKNNTEVITGETRPSVIVAAISRPLAAAATVQPMNSDIRRCTIKIPLFNQNMWAWTCCQV